MAVAVRRHLLWTLRSANVSAHQHLHPPPLCYRLSQFQVGNWRGVSRSRAGEENVWGETLWNRSPWQRQTSLSPCPPACVPFRELSSCLSLNHSVSVFIRKVADAAEMRGSQLPSALSCVLGHQSLRHKSGGKKSSSSSSSDEESDMEELDDDDYEAPTNFKKMKVYLKSLRADSVVSSGLDISRNRVDEIFFGSRLRLNGEKLLKKSKQMEEGDYVDLVVERSTEDDKLMVKRVKIIEVSSERTNKDKIAVTVKVWKSAFPIDDPSRSEWK